MDTRQDRLWCREGNSDKVYALALTQEHGGTWKVYAEWGRRGAKLQGATKYDGADLEAAQKVYDRLLKEKVGKGYEPLMAGPPDSGDEKVADEPAARAAPAVNVAAALPVVMRARLGQSAWLPSDAEPEEIPGLLADPAWWLQEKKDGIHLLTHRLPDRVVGTNRRGQVHPVPPEIDAALGTLPVGIVLDGEKVGVYEGAEVARYTYALYDCLQTGAHDLRGEGYAVRWEALVTIHAALAKISPAIDLVRNATSAEAKAVLMHQLEHEIGRAHV